MWGIYKDVFRYFVSMLFEKRNPPPVSVLSDPPLTIPNSSSVIILAQIFTPHKAMTYYLNAPQEKKRY